MDRAEPASHRSEFGAAAGTAADKSFSNILVIEDSPSLSRVYARYLEQGGYACTVAATGGAALDLMAKAAPDAILLDLKLPDMYGLDLLSKVIVDDDPPPVIVITAHGSVNVAVEAMQAGATDFLVKPFKADRLLTALGNVRQRTQMRRLADVKPHDGPRNTYHKFIGASPKMQAVYRTIESAAPSKATVFITGESGTGKELCAEAIHACSGRAKAELVALNCAAIPRDLIESEIFGHHKGAFTGAISDRVGAAAQADGGTLFLDEICEMDLNLQSKLLRFIQTGRFTPVGGTKEVSVDVRFVCATNRHPLVEVTEGRFREDLYYRLHVVPVHMPPLRERDGDVIEIAEQMLESFAAEEGKAFKSFSPEVIAALRAHTWPGNIRELLNVVRNIVVLHDGDAVTLDMLPAMMAQTQHAVSQHHGLPGQAAAPAHMAPASPAAPSTIEADGGQAPMAINRLPRTEDDIRPLKDVERAFIEAAIDACGGNIPRAAARLGISASTIYRKRLDWGDDGS